MSKTFKKIQIQHHQKNNLGFTLIELMIAISILSMLMFTGAYSYSLMSERWNKELGQYNQTLKLTKNTELFQRLLEGIQPFVIIDSERKPSFFFIGHHDSLMSVSRRGLNSKPFLEVFRLTAIETDPGKFDLIYQSTSTENLMLNKLDQEIIFTKSIKLYENVDKVSFEYFGWKSIIDKSNSAESGAQKQWYQQYSGINSKLLPEVFIVKVIISGKALSFPVELDADSGKWLSSYMESSYE